MSEPTLFELDDTLTVGQINRRLGQAVRSAYPNDVWVQGQIRNLSRSARGHVYFDLVDPVPAGAAPKASISVTLFDSNRQIVNRVLTRTGNAVRIDDGVEVRIRATLDFYAPRGQVQLNMTSIDPEFTLGRLGADRDQLLRLLKEEGLIDANGVLPFPLVPLRVGLVTSEASAAQADFVEQLATCRYAFSITALGTRVQGEFAPEEIAQAIEYAATLDVDVIAVVRGGGARTDLAAFDTEPVARAIAGAPVPVICGIGHEIDSSVADIVAHQSLKTPTACAQHLIERVASFEATLDDRTHRLATLASAVPAMQRSAIDELARRTAGLARTRLANASERNVDATGALDRRVARALIGSRERLVAATTRLRAASGHAVTSAARRCADRRTALDARSAHACREGSRRLDVLQARLDAVDPVRALRRGYSITTTGDGALVRSARAVEPESELVTHLADGTVTSTVTSRTTLEDRP